MAGRVRQPLESQAQKMRGFQQIAAFEVSGLHFPAA